VGLILHPHLQTLNRGAIYGLLSGILLAIAIITVRVLASTEPPARQLFYYALVSTLICFPLLLRNWQTMQVHELLLLCMSYFTIVFAGVFGWLLWSETPDIRTFIGVALVLFSGVLTVLTGRKQEAAETRFQTR
jgi:drug/metabolite transporter (DMT)-like permease